MSTTPTDDTTGTALPPNHHAHHPGFSGFGGAVAAIGFTIGRGAAADLAVELTGVGPGDDLVDVGCGPGTAVRRAAARGATSAVGVDPAAVMRRVGRLVTRASRRRIRRAVRYLDGTAESLPLPDGSASVVWSLATVHHWQDVDAGLAEVVRVLRPGGRFLAVERRTVPGATGLASHGWTDDQAEAFADRCCTAGLTDPTVTSHRPGRGRALALLAQAP